MGMSLKEPLPEREHGKWSSGQKHESQFGDSGVRVVLFGWDQGSSPEKLIIGQGVAEVGGMKEGVQVVETVVMCLSDDGGAIMVVVVRL